MGDAMVMMPSKTVELPVPARKLTIMNALLCGFHATFATITLVVGKLTLTLTPASTPTPTPQLQPVP
eukprot:scaffold65689_cov33-Phaeocystis_antarctica.AAC.1